MRILIDGRFWGLENAGLGRYTINLLKELAKIDAKNQYVVLLRKKYFGSLDLPDNWKSVLADFRHYSLAEQMKLPKIISCERPELVHFLHFNTPLSFQGKFIATIHDLIMHKQKKDATIQPLQLYLLKRLAYKTVFRHSVKASVKIIVPSEFTKSEILKNYNISKEKICVIHEGVNEGLYQQPKIGITARFGLAPQYFIYVGNSYPYKNLKRAIEAIRLVNQNLDKPVFLAIAGPRDGFYKRLKGQVEHLGAQKFVKLLGFVHDEDLRALYANSLGFIYPSLVEGFGLQGLEAMASGTLVLASDIPVFREIYEGNVLYFNPYDFSSIAKVMKDALEMGSEERGKIISKGQEFIKRYSWSKMAQETLMVYKEAIKS